MNKQDANELLMYIDALERYIEHESHIEEIKLYSMFNLISLCVAFFLGYIAVGSSIDEVYRWILVCGVFIIYLFTVIKFSGIIIDERIGGDYMMYFQLFAQLKIELLTNPENLNKEVVLDLLQLIGKKFDMTRSTFNKIIYIIENS